MVVQNGETTKLALQRRGKIYDGDSSTSASKVYNDSRVQEPTQVEPSLEGVSSELRGLAREDSSFDYRIERDLDSSK